MRLTTYQEVEAKVRLDLDLQDEDNFVQNDEFAGYANEAIDIAEAEILKLSEDYFLTPANLTLVAGTSDYALPTNIYAQKIRSLIYKNGPKIYPVKRIRDPELFYKREELNYYSTSETEYGYMLLNAVEQEQAKISLSPIPQESGQYLRLWYIRNAQRIPLTTDSGAPTRATQLATVIDIPEWVGFVIQYMKWRAMLKEMSPFAKTAEATMLELKKNMVETLSNRVVDNDDTIPPAIDFYVEHN